MTRYRLFQFLTIFLGCVLIGLFFTNATLRTLSNLNGEVRDPTNVFRLYAEDWNELVAKVSSGTDGINTKDISIAGTEIVDSSRNITGATVVSEGNIYGDTSSQAMLCIHTSIAYTDTSAKNLLSVPAGAIVWDIDVYVSTAFNDSTTDTIDIGITGSSTRYDTGVDVSGTGFATLSLSNIPDYMSATYVTATYVGGTGDASQGAAYIYIWYTRND